MSSRTITLIGMENEIGDARKLHKKAAHNTKSPLHKVSCQLLFKEAAFSPRILYIANPPSMRMTSPVI